jgi:hypothetical protein
MSNGKIAMLSGLAALLVSTSAAPAHVAGDCAVLDQLYREARTDFTALKRKALGGALCSYATHEYECAWSFSTDRYGEAEDQIDRLARCTAAQAGATPLPANRREKAFQINPETSVIIRGPDSNGGNWKIQLKVKTSSDWN